MSAAATSASKTDFITLTPSTPSSKTESDLVSDLGTVTLRFFHEPRETTIPRKNKPMWQYLKDDIVPAINGWTVEFGKWETACVTARYNEGNIAFNANNRLRPMLELIPDGAVIFCMLWMGCGTMNWRIEHIGNACDTPFLEDQTTCCVCIDTIRSSQGSDGDGKTPWMLKCGHVFHKECFAMYSSDLCPICRKTRDINEIRWSKI